MATDGRSGHSLAPDFIRNFRQRYLWTNFCIGQFCFHNSTNKFADTLTDVLFFKMFFNVFMHYSCVGQFTVLLPIYCHFQKAIQTIKQKNRLECLNIHIIIFFNQKYHFVTPHAWNFNAKHLPLKYSAIMIVLLMCRICA